MEEQDKELVESELGRKVNDSRLSFDSSNQTETEDINEQSDVGSTDVEIENDPSLISLRRFFFF